MNGPRRSLAAALVAGALTASGCTGGAEEPPGPGGSRAAAVDGLIALQMRWAGVPGLAVAVVDGERLAFSRAIGLASVEHRVPLTTASLFQLSSTAKAFTGVAAALLVRDGRVDLEAPLRRYLGGLPASWGGITVRQLLTHTSGLPEVLDCAADSREEALACVTRLPSKDAPGERFRYNQTNYFLALQVIEHVSGQPFEDFMRSRVFEPSGMRSTAYAGSVFDLVPGRATSYYPDGRGGLRLRDYDFPEYLYSAAGLHSNLEDLVRFAQALGSGQLLGEDDQRLLWEGPTLSGGQVSTYGLGWDLKTHGRGWRSAGHEGGGLTTIRKFLDDSLTVIVLANGASARFDPDRLATRVAAVYAPHLASPADDLLDAMRSRLLDGQIEEARDAHVRFAREPRWAEVDTEAAINTLGYDLLERGRPDEATAIFRLNVARYPESANVHDSLGEALAANGEGDAAVASYRESLRLDPSNDNAVKMIQKLEAVER